MKNGSDRGSSNLRTQRLLAPVDGSAEYVEEDDHDDHDQAGHALHAQVVRNNNSNRNQLIIILVKHYQAR